MIESAYVFDMKTTFPVNVKQCHIAKDEYIVRDLEREIVKSVKEELVRMGDINQRQKVCLMPVTDKLELLPEKPKSWGEIKDGKFMIINGQHSIVASQELQISGCGEKRKKELEYWDAYIVWSKEAMILVRISEFYNMCNHLNHAQPTWGTNILSARNVWISQDKPTNMKDNNRHNGALYNTKKYQVSEHETNTRFLQDDCVE